MSSRTLHRELERMAEAVGRGSWPGVYASAYDLVLREGLDYQPASLPTSVRQGLPKACFANAGRLARRRADLDYVEGYGLVEGIDLPTVHAWCVDGDGRVVDPTWGGDQTPAPVAYRGLVIPTEVVVRLAARRGHGLLENPAVLHALLRDRWQPERLGQLLRDVGARQPAGSR